MATMAVVAASVERRAECGGGWQAVAAKGLAVALVAGSQVALVAVAMLATEVEPLETRILAQAAETVRAAANGIGTAHARTD
jgi:hypothetical protein